MANQRAVEHPQDNRDERYREWFEDNMDTGSDCDEPFKDLIQRDPVVCDNCFALRYDVVKHEWWRGTFGWSTYERWVPREENSDPVPAEGVTNGMRLACANCGFRYDKQRPIPKRLILGFAENISDTLEFKDIAHDRDVLKHEISRRNTSMNQGRQDSHVFAPAVRRAITEGRKHASTNKTGSRR